MSVEIVRHVVLDDDSFVVLVERACQNGEQSYACMRPLELPFALSAVLWELCQDLEQIALHYVGVGEASLHVVSSQLDVVMPVPSYQVVQDGGRLVTNCYVWSASLPRMYSMVRLQ